MRGTVFEYQSYEALQHELGKSGNDLELPCCGCARDGEWLLVTFRVGEESTSIAGCVSGADGEQRLRFESRDWGELQLFAEGKGPSSGQGACTHRSDPVTVTPPPGCSVLVVDDDPDVQEVVTAVLRAKGFVVKSVESAEEALECVRDAPPRMLLVDWNLPGMSGLDLCRKLRSSDALADTPVVFLTSHSSQEDLLAAFAAGADDFVSKPFRAHELGARMLGLLERRLGSLRCAG